MISDLFFSNNVILCKNFYIQKVICLYYLYINCLLQIYVIEYVHLYMLLMLIRINKNMKKSSKI